MKLFIISIFFITIVMKSVRNRWTNCIIFLNTLSFLCDFLFWSFLCRFILRGSQAVGTTVQGNSARRKRGQPNLIKNGRISLTEFRHQMRLDDLLAYFSLNHLVNSVIECYWCYFVNKPRRVIRCVSFSAIFP